MYGISATRVEGYNVVQLDQNCPYGEGGEMTREVREASAVVMMKRLTTHSVWRLDNAQEEEYLSLDGGQILY